MDNCLVRLEPYDPRCGRVLRRYTYRGIRFQEACGWYRVSAEVAEYLGTVRQIAGDVRTPLAFEIRWPDEAQAPASTAHVAASPCRVMNGEGAVLEAASSSHDAESDPTALKAVTHRRIAENEATEPVAASAGRALESALPVHEVCRSYQAIPSDDVVLSAASWDAGNLGDERTLPALDVLMPEEPLASPAAGGEVPVGPEETSSPPASSYYVLAAMPETAVLLSMLEEAGPAGDEPHGADGLLVHAVVKCIGGDGSDHGDQAIEPVVAATRVRHGRQPEHQEASGVLLAPGCALPGSGRSARSPPGNALRTAATHRFHQQLTRVWSPSARLRASTHVPCGRWGDALAPP